MKDLATAFLLLFGSTFMFLAALGVFRFPDLMTRMHAAGKASTLGTASMLLGVLVHFWDLRVGIIALLVIFLVFLTAPVASHMLARAAFLLGMPLWHGRGKKAAARGRE
jgi:multicomponent Na+:H+ antiporter subunit G